MVKECTLARLSERSELFEPVVIVLSALKQAESG